MQSTPNWRALLRDPGAPFRIITRGGRSLSMETIAPERTPRVVGDLATRTARIGTFHCPYCAAQHPAPMVQERETVVRARCRRLPPGVARFVIVRAWSPALDCRARFFHSVSTGGA